MSKLKLFAALALVAIGIVAAPLSASGPPKVPVVADWAVTDNLTALGYAPRPNPAAGVFNSDLAFWGDYAFQGTYDGFRIVDIKFPSRPKEVLFQPCNGNQGDIVIWGNGQGQARPARPLVQHTGSSRPDLRRADDPDRVRGHPRLRPVELREPAARRAGAGDGRVAHRDARARTRPTTA